MIFTKYRKTYYYFSASLVLISIVAVFAMGLLPGIEFVGGSNLEVEYEEERPAMEEIRESLEVVDLREVQVQPLGEKRAIIRTEEADEKTYKEIMSALEGAREVRFEAIGPTIGEELRGKAILAIIISSLLIVLYISISFKEEDGLINSTKYGVVAAVIAFFHDILIILGIFAFLGYFFGAQVTIPIAVALLTTLGYSINDTVVIFDRVRENLQKYKEEKELKEIVDISLNETLGRSLSTSLTTLFVLFALLFLGGTTLFYFVLTLILGIMLGTYSSIFLAAPLVFDWNNLTNKREKGIK